MTKQVMLEALAEYRRGAEDLFRNAVDDADRNRAHLDMKRADDIKRWVDQIDDPDPREKYRSKVARLLSVALELLEEDE